MWLKWYRAQGKGKNVCTYYIAIEWVSLDLDLYLYDQALREPGHCARALYRYGTVSRVKKSHDISTHMYGLTSLPARPNTRWAGDSYWGREKTKIIGTALSASGWCYVHAIDLSVDVLTRLGLWASTAFYWKVARQYKDRQRRLRTKSSTKTTLAYSSSCLKQLRPYLMGIARSNVLGKLGRRIC